MDFNDDENIEWLMESSKTVEDVAENDDDFRRREKESIELCRFLQVLRDSFENEPILVECKAKGTIRCEEDIQKLLKNLKVLGYFFSIRTSEKKTCKPNCKLMIINKKSPPSSHPYRVLSHVRYYCSQKQKHNSEADVEKTKTRRTTNCQAILDIRQVEVFTSVPLSSVRRKRVEMLKVLRRRLFSNSPPKGEIKFGVVISLPKTHTHPLQVKGQYLNEEVKAAMHYVLRSGTTSVEGIQKKLYAIVDREFENGPIKPSRENSAFYPNQKTIYNHLRRDGLVMKRFYKKRAMELTDLKTKTKEVLNSVIDRVDTCNDFNILVKLYKRSQSILNVWEIEEGR